MSHMHCTSGLLYTSKPVNYKCLNSVKLFKWLSSLFVKRMILINWNLEIVVKSNFGQYRTWGKMENQPCEWTIECETWRKHHWQFWCWRNRKNARICLYHWTFMTSLPFFSVGSKEFLLLEALAAWNSTPHSILFYAKSIL